LVFLSVCLSQFSSTLKSPDADTSPSHLPYPPPPPTQESPLRWWPTSRTAARLEPQHASW
jgi:hypothetical protein